MYLSASACEHNYCIYLYLYTFKPWARMCVAADLLIDHGSTRFNHSSNVLECLPRDNNLPKYTEINAHHRSAQSTMSINFLVHASLPRLSRLLDSRTTHVCTRRVTRIQLLHEDILKVIHYLRLKLLAGCGGEQGHLVLDVSGNLVFKAAFMTRYKCSLMQKCKGGEQLR
jgi:hypothetical protein